MTKKVSRLQVIDSHTGGEPTRVIVDGAPDLGSGNMNERLEVLRRDHDRLRTALMNEPRGSEVMVGALLCEPVDPANTAGVIFFNNVGYLGMCGHGTLGLVATLAHMGKITPGEHVIETPVGPVQVTLHDNHRATLANVPSYRYRKAVAVEVEGHGIVHGDIAWGGNWFFLVSDHGQELDLASAEALTDFSWRVRQALERSGITAAEGDCIDHVELFGPPSDPAKADSQNFVLCPGKAYDRSPCGTGTSAKLACLHADGLLELGQVWRQESIVGSVFEGQVTAVKDDAILPMLSGSAYVNGEVTLICHPDDPYAWGIG